MRAWAAYVATDGHARTLARLQLGRDYHVGEVWTAFMTGYLAADPEGARAPSSEPKGRGGPLPVIARVPVKSSNVVSVGYDEATMVLEVEYVGHQAPAPSGGGSSTVPSVYRYLGVEPAHWRALEAVIARGGSVGQYLNREVKPLYRCVKVERRAEPEAAQVSDVKRT